MSEVVVSGSAVARFRELAAVQFLADEDSLSDPISRAMLYSVSGEMRWEWMFRPAGQASAYVAIGGALPPQDIEVPGE